MAIPLTKFELIPGYFQITDDSGRKHLIAIKDALRAADIPALTYQQVAGIKNLANLIVVLVRTLIDRQILDESFLENDDYSLDAIIEAVESLGGNYSEPDIVATVP
jgi:hypothetical protein